MNTASITIRINLVDRYNSYEFIHSPVRGSIIRLFSGVRLYDYTYTPAVL